MFWTSDGKMSRISVFFDGGFFDKVDKYHHYYRKHGYLRFLGVLNFIRHMASDYEGIAKASCQIVEAHYFRGRFATKDMEAAGKLRDFSLIQDELVEAGIVEHYLPPKWTPTGPRERGVDVWLSLEALDLAVHKRFDVLALVAGDGDYLPLIRKLNGIGIRTMLLAWDFDYDFIDSKGERKHVETRTAPVLKEACTYEIAMVPMIDDPPKKGGKPDPVLAAVLDGLFGA
jgi:uncharacterized LabA/DUF88 family protein